MNLQELTGYESGAVIFKESNEGFITNWSSIEGIPRIFATGIIGLNDGNDLQKVDENEVDVEYIQVAIELAENDKTELLANGEELLIEENIIDSIFENNEVVIVTFEGWN